MTPIDALSKACEAAVLSSREQKPGVVVRALPKEMREALERLTPDDARSMRLPWR